MSSHPSVELATAVLNRRGAAALSCLLEQVAEQFNADGCVFWVADPLGRAADVSSAERLFVLAAWFPDGQRLAVHDLPIFNSTVGAVVHSEALVVRHGLMQDEPVLKDYPLIKELDLREMVCAQLRFDAERVGAMSLFRGPRRPGFTAAEVHALGALSGLVAGIYNTVQERMNLDLLERVGTILSAADDGPGTDLDDERDSIKRKFQDVCTALAESFHASEVTLFLRDPFSSSQPEAFATTWTEPVTLGTGATRWAYDHATTVRIFDLRRFTAERSFYAQKYPGMVWKDGMKLAAAGKEPLSYMAVPIPSTRAPLGVVRLSASRFADRSCGPYYFDHQAETWLKLVAAQLGWYWGTWVNRRRVAAQRESWQARVFEDLAHQLRGPLVQLQHRVRRLIRGRDDVARALPAVNGLARKAHGMAKSMRLLAMMADDKSPTPRRAAVDRDLLVQKLIEMADDNQVMLDPDRLIHFSVDRESFGGIAFTRYWIDLELLEQAVNNLLDNAGKYSLPKTRVTISGGPSNKGNLTVIVSNRGLRIRKEDIPRLRHRGWRAPEAQMVTGEGAGIGLWIVDQIMKAHGGYLEIQPTDDRGLNHFRLIFPGGT